MHACVRSLEHEPASPLAVGFTNTASYVTERHGDATTSVILLVSQLFTFLVPVPVSVPVPAFPCFPVARNHYWQARLSQSIYVYLLHKCMYSSHTTGSYLSSVCHQGFVRVQPENAPHQNRCMSGFSYFKWFRTF